jgi:hypothetical protein
VRSPATIQSAVSLPRDGLAMLLIPCIPVGSPAEAADRSPGRVDRRGCPAARPLHPAWDAISHPR